MNPSGTGARPVASSCMASGMLTYRTWPSARSRLEDSISCRDSREGMLMPHSAVTFALSSGVGLNKSTQNASAPCEPDELEVIEYIFSIRAAHWGVGADHGTNGGQFLPVTTNPATIRSARPLEGLNMHLFALVSIFSAAIGVVLVCPTSAATHSDAPSFGP